MKITMFKKSLQRALFWMSFVIFGTNIIAQTVNVVPTGSTQADFVNAYKLVLQAADNDYHATSANFDPSLFPLWGEHSVYWISSGADAGSFMLPDEIPAGFNNVTRSTKSNYNWKNAAHYAVQFKAASKAIAVFESSFQQNGQSINWESVYFQGILSNFMMDNMHYVCDENSIISSGFSGNTKLLIIPAFTQVEGNNKVYIDSIFVKYPSLVQKLNAFLAIGGTIYTEGNAAYFAEKLGHLAKGAINFSDAVTSANNYHNITFSATSQPFSFCVENTKVYASAIPKAKIPADFVLATLNSDSRPVYYQINNANGGRILSNLAMPAVGGYLDLKSGGKQLQWAYNAILSAFISDIDVTRNVFNQLPAGTNIGNNGVSYDAVDTFEISVKIRNVSPNAVSAIEVVEDIQDYFNFVDVLGGVSFTRQGNKLTFSNLSLGSNSETLIKYRVSTPALKDSVHEKVDEYLDKASLMHVSKGLVSYIDGKGLNRYQKYRNYADIMFGARLMADADVNWKNFLGLEYQAFKVFMNLENKERTTAEETVYTQYIPKDVPFYWSDQSINIPILKTPGGKFVTVLKGSNNAANPDYDMDSDGKPDAWLDTASIYPKGYTIVEEEVYWQNPWAHLKGATTAVFEDIDHDGVRAQDTNGDGIVDIQEPGDKIRAWKVVWNINKVPGYQYYEPYCSYELWIDPANLVNMSKGAAFVKGTIPKDNEMFYPYAPNINSANAADTSWTHWMERDKAGKVIWKNLILQSVGNYEGFTYVDNSYQMKPTDKLVGLVPQPHQEFLAVVSMGGEEIDMTHPTPSNSMYSKIKYKTIFNENKVTPIRTTYTYWAPLPNPLQFEYLSNNFVIKDSLNADTLKVLPKFGKANVTFEIDASTEYTYYWIRGVGHDVDYNDPSLAAEGVEGLGDGVFGYFIYEIPKGMGGYKMSLPKKADGSFDVNAIVQIDGAPFKKWLDNPNTLNQVEIWEDEFKYLVYIPQVLIPPALDDDNFDGIDDWKDDKGDRFQSKTGFLHDAFMLGNGEDYPAGSPNVFTHKDDIYGTVESGWSAGPDKTYGDDFFENLGKTHFTIHAIYEGKGKEGPVDVGKGGTLVVEEIFGGSPWVIFSHVIIGFAEGVDYKITSQINPNLLGFGKDTCIIKHVVESLDEPHSFDHNFEPYSRSYGNGELTATAVIGGKDPCSLITPDAEFHSIVDLAKEKANFTLVPLADKTNPDLADYPKSISGTFTIIKVEINNGTNQNLVNTTVTPVFSSTAGNSAVIMSYVAYPRPLVPSIYLNGAIVPGDQIGAFKAGWRFNQPENEVLVKMGNTLNMLQPSRKAYFIFLVKLDPNHPKGIFDVKFTCQGERIGYDGKNKRALKMEIPVVKYSVTEKNGAGQAISPEKFIIGTGKLDNITTKNTSLLKPLQKVKWSLEDVSPADFNKLTKTLPTTIAGNQIINLSQFGNFPSLDTSKFTVLEQFETTILKSTDTLASISENLNYTYNGRSYTTSDSELVFSALGPMVEVRKTVVAVNGVPITNVPITITAASIILDVKVSVINYGNDIARDVKVDLFDTENYAIVPSTLPANCTYNKEQTICSMGTIIPGQNKDIIVQYKLTEADNNNITIVLDEINSIFTGTFVDDKFNVKDLKPLNLKAYDFRLIELSYEQIDNEKISIHATAVNRGIVCDNVKIKIHPVIDGVVQPNIAESVIHNMANSQVAGINTEYYFGGIKGDLKLVATIDPDNAYIELYENNNSAELKFTLTSLENLNKNVRVSAYPNPSNAEVTFLYNVSEAPRNVTIHFYTMNGIEVDQLESKSGTSGANKLNYNTSGLAAGKYIYKVVINSGTQSLSYNGVLVKE